jgi:hypothetical protein
MTGDTCPECGQALPGAARDDDCTCADGVVMHRFGQSEEATKGKRTACSRLGCTCEAYTPVVTP